jgi:hypothetical protein
MEGNVRQVCQRTLVAAAVGALVGAVDCPPQTVTSANAALPSPKPHASTPSAASTAQTVIDPIPGYPETGKNAWRAKNDRVFLDAVNRYNAANGYRPGDPGYWTANLLKAQAMVESGANPRIFATDPLKVNSPGDWFDDKHSRLGLTKGQAMTPEISAKAALEWLQYKGWRHDAGGRAYSYRGDEFALGAYDGSDLPHRDRPVSLRPSTVARRPSEASRLLASMKHQGFDSATDPFDPITQTGARVRFVGLLRAGGASFKIYHYDHYAAHGIHATVVMAASGKYLGAYWLDAEPIGTQGADILFVADKSDWDRVHFGPNGPPSHAWVAGEFCDLAAGHRAAL